MSRFFAVLYILAALMGLVFSSLSTSDFAQHLDRQVHAIHCSFVPGLAPITDATSGCHVALMSTWSSVFRSWVWGGIPVALPGMAVFAFLIFRAVELWVGRRLRDSDASLFLLVATLIPVITSIVFAGIAVFELDAFCRTCAGIYTASAVCLFAAVGLVYTTWDVPSVPRPVLGPASKYEDEDDFEHPALLWTIGIAEGIAFVLVLTLLYVLAVPDHGKYVGACGGLDSNNDPNKVLVPIGRHRGPHAAIEVFDPLCPACRGFEARLAAAGLDKKLDRKALLFPLDNTCNWMITSSIHPGACTISEAILCAEDDVNAVIDWAFANQEAIREAARADKKAAKRMVVAKFPGLSKCVGSAGARQRLNRSLRWAVQNELPILTPQLYVDGKKLCDEDTDLGLDFALSRLIARSEGR